jgi:hypothetical protein
VIPLDRDGIATSPEFLAVLERKAAQLIALGFLIIIKEVYATIGYDRPGMSFTEIHGP